MWFVRLLPVQATYQMPESAFHCFHFGADAICVQLPTPQHGGTGGGGMVVPGGTHANWRGRRTLEFLEPKRLRRRIQIYIHIYICIYVYIYMYIIFLYIYTYTEG